MTFSPSGCAMVSILLVDDDETFGPRIAEYLRHFDYEVTLASTLVDARSAVEADIPRAAVVDLMLPDGSGIDLLGDCEARGVPAIVVTGHATVEHAVGSLRARASDFLVKPFKLEELKERLDGLLRSPADRVPQGGEAERQPGHAELKHSNGVGPLIGRCPAMQALYESLRRVAPSAATVLIIGESGTGKELVAQVVHQSSPRAKGPFLAVNCGAVAHELIASELFGHERGSFTGAHRQHVGVFEQAGGGTLFLDEITEMPPELQVNLLRVLETGSFRRVGGKDRHSGGRAPRRCDESTTGSRHEGESIARRSFLPAERVSGRGAAHFASARVTYRFSPITF